MAETAEHIDLDSPLQCWNTIEYDDKSIHNIIKSIKTLHTKMTAEYNTKTN